MSFRKGDLVTPTDESDEMGVRTWRVVDVVMRDGEPLTYWLVDALDEEERACVNAAFPLREVTREDYCSHPERDWCDCDWCRYMRRCRGSL